MTTYTINTNEFKEALAQGEEFLLVLEDGRVYYQDVNSQADDAEYSMVVDPTMYEDFDEVMMAQEVQDWNAIFAEMEKDIEVKLA